MSVRIKRLQSEYERLKVVFGGHERIHIVDTVGRPPDKYVVEYRVKGLIEEAGEVHERNVHRAEINLGMSYPLEMPRCVMLTPVFHPNIDHLAVCTEDIGAAGQTLDQTIIFIGEMICYQAYNLQSPRNGDAARWTQEHLDQLPLENVNLVPSVLLAGGADLEIARAATAALAQTRSALACANCGRSDGDAEVISCAHGHAACKDCRPPCANCGAGQCLLCQVQRCIVCHQLYCTDCTLPCATCGRPACLTHVKPCRQCASWTCAAHLDAAGFCPLCTPRPAAAPEPYVERWS